MNHRMHVRRAALCSLIFILSACGGGGGSDDSGQAFTDTAVVAVPTGNVIVQTRAGVLVNARQVEQPPSAPQNLEYPYGFIAFDVTGLSSGASVLVRLEFPQVLAGDQYIKCVESGACSPFAGAVLRDNGVELTLTDGGAGDADGQANGVIRDPGALARPLVDTDQDSVVDPLDNCPVNANSNQTDTDDDGIGDACDSQDNRDSDADGVENFEDNCPDIANPDQVDSDGNGVGDACEPEAPLETVLRTGNIFAVQGYDPQSDLIDLVISENAALAGRGEALLQGIYGDATIDWVLGRRTSYVDAPGYQRKLHGQIPLLLQNGGRLQALAGVYRNAFARYSLFGSNPPLLFSQGENASFEPAFRRLVAWLLGDDPGEITALSSATRVVVARAHNSADIEEWFGATLPNATVSRCANADALSSCTAAVRLLILGKNGQAEQLDADVEEIDRLLRTGVPVLYLHTALEHDTAASTAYSAVFGANFPGAGNYFVGEDARNAQWADADAMFKALTAGTEGIDTALAHVRDGDFALDFVAGRSGNTVETAQVPGYEAEFGLGATTLQTEISAMEADGFRVFDAELDAHRRERAYALIGDRLRQDVQFPMDILESDQNAFLASYLADHLVYNQRVLSPQQPDRGFHGSRDYSQVTPQAYSASIPTRFRGKKPTGAYVLPGQAFTVTRTDANSEVAVDLFWNLQSPGAVYAFRTHDSQDHYNMPKYLKSRSYRLQAGETLRLSSAYGGVVHVSHAAVEGDGVTIDLAFENVGTHPFYNGPETAAAFTAAMASGEYDWAEIVTPETYVTSPTQLLQDSLDELTSRLGWDIDEVARVASDYYYNAMFSLSGYVGFDIPARSAEEAAFCASNGWECDNTDYHGANGVVEGNIRQYITNCGSFGGCSNQPVTYTWLWDPLGAGPVHERGHHLEGNSGADFHRFAPFNVHQLTNTWRSALPYFYYRDTGGVNGGNTGACGVHRSEHRGNGARYAALQAAFNSGDPVTYMNQNVWGVNTSFDRPMITQLAAHAANQGRFTEGWDYLPLMLTLAREFKAKLDEGEAAFDNAKARYGFGQYSHADALDLVSTREGQRSWFLVAYSFITGRDQRDYFTMLGWAFDDQAASQVQSMLLLPAAQQFYAFDDVCSIADAMAVPVDGTTTWPEDRPSVD